MGDVVVVVGTEGAMSTAVLERLVGNDDVERVIAVGARDPQLAVASSGSAPISWVEPSSASGDLKRLFEGAGAVIHLGAAPNGRAVSRSAPRSVDGTDRVVDVRLARRVLDAASATSVRHVTILSGAMVYGAWANNPVPLTEEATLRPDPGVDYAIALGEIERLAAEWRDANPSAGVAVLRPTITVPSKDAAPGGGASSKWLNRSPWVPVPWRAGDVGQPSQYVLDADLADAVALAHRDRLDGPFNVAPEGWISPEVLPELAGPMPQVRVPPVIADVLMAVRLRQRGYPPAVASYLHQPWVIASDRLRAAGWTPADSNEEAFVGAYEGGPFSSMDAHRRQMLSLGAVGVGVAGVVLAAVAVVRRRRR